MEKSCKVVSMSTLRALLRFYSGILDRFLNLANVLLTNSNSQSTPDKLLKNFIPAAFGIVISLHNF